jgi:hypothetical protein
MKVRYGQAFQHAKRTVTIVDMDDMSTDDRKIEIGGKGEETTQLVSVAEYYWRERSFAEGRFVGWDDGAHAHEYGGKCDGDKRKRHDNRRRALYFPGPTRPPAALNQSGSACFRASSSQGESQGRWWGLELLPDGAAAHQPQTFPRETHARPNQRDAPVREEVPCTVQTEASTLSAHRTI